MLNTPSASTFVYFSVNGVRYWALLTPSGAVWYRKEGSKTRYLGRLSAGEIKEVLAKAGTETLQRIKSDVEAVSQALDRQLTAVQTSQLSQPPSQQPSLTWKKDGHTYWLLCYHRVFYIYMKGPTTRHRPRLVEKTDVSGVIGRVVAAGAAHVLEALRALVNGLHAAVADLVRPPAETPKKPQTPLSKPQRAQVSRKAEEERVSRREAEEALRKLRGELRRAVEKWRLEWSQEAEKRGWAEPDDEWLKERLSDFVDTYSYLLEKILPYEDLVDKFADAAVEATYGRLIRRDVLEVLKEL